MAEAPGTPISGGIMEEAAPRPVFPASPELLWADRASRGPGLKHFKGALAPGSGAGWEHTPAADRRERRGSSGRPALGTGGCEGRRRGAPGSAAPGGAGDNPPRAGSPASQPRRAPPPRLGSARRLARGSPPISAQEESGRTVRHNDLGLTEELLYN